MLVGTSEDDVALAEPPGRFENRDVRRVNVDGGAEAHCIDHVPGNADFMPSLVVRRRIVDSVYIRRVEHVAIEDRQRTDAEPGELLDHRRSGSAGADDAYVQTAQEPLDVESEGADLAVVELRQVVALGRMIKKPKPLADHADT